MTRTKKQSTEAAVREIRLTGTNADIRGPKNRKAKKRRAIASGSRAEELLEWLERHVGAERGISDPDGPLFTNSNAYNDGGWWSETACVEHVGRPR